MSAVIAEDRITLTSRPMSLWHIDFQELYARHLCRHSQFGINAAHLAALAGTWFGVYAASYWIARVPWLPVALAAAYLAVLAIHTPVRVLIVTLVFLSLFVGAVLLAPELPLWAYLLMIPVCYKLQSWSHKIWRREEDMTEYNKKYTKGSVLFVVLLFYEVPLVLNYLFFRPSAAFGADAGSGTPKPSPMS